MNQPLLLEARDVSYRIGERQILEHISLGLHESEILTVIGPNGAGKTSLLRLLIGLAQPSAGTVIRQTGLRIGYMPQRIDISPTLPLSVERFLHLAERSREKVLAIADEVGIRELLTTPLSGVSGGEFQRILLARALLREPRLLVLDEPTQGVDVTGQVEMYSLIDTVRLRHQCAVLMISHDLHLVMAATDTVLCLNRHMCCAGKPEHVTADPAFLQLFGAQVTKELAIYPHHHDHQHDLHGAVVEHPHG